LNLLYLALSTFSQTGGIEKVNKSWLKALSNLQEGFQFKLSAHLLMDNQADTNYLSKNSFKGFKGNKIYFILSSLTKALKSDVIVLSHINLAIIAVLVKKVKPKTQIFLHAHGIEVWRPLSKLQRKALQVADRILAVSTFTANELIRIHGVDKTKIQVLNNALAPDFKAPEDLSKPANLLKQYDLQTDQPILFTLARLSSAEQYKGYDQVIEVMPALLKRFPDLVYLIGGKADTAEQERLNGLIEKQGLVNNIKLLGFIPDTELIDHYLLGDVFVMPSKGEGFGISFIEAAACGRPVLAGNTDGSTDAVLNGQLGQLINPDNLTEMETAITQLFKENRSEANAYTIQQKCLKAFSFEAYQEKIKKLIFQ